MSDTQPTALVELVARYYNNPVLFVREQFGAEPDEWQAQVLTDIAAGERRISVRSGHGVGKSTTAAWAVIWFATTRFPFKVAITAPTSSQLFDALWPEIGSWMKKLPEPVRELFEVTGDRIRLKASPADGFVTAKTSRAEQPEAMQGVHSAHVLLIADEASGIPEPVFEAAQGSMSGTGCTTLLLGNPVRSSGLFYRTHNSLTGWKRYHVSCLTSNRVSDEFVQEIVDSYGADSNAYRIRVLGEFPLADDNTVIPMELIEAAMMRDITTSPNEPVVWGLDVARFGSNSSVLTKRRGSVVAEKSMSWSGLDTMQLCGRIKEEYDAATGPDKPIEIFVDSVGVGGGVADRLKELDLPVRGINVGESSPMKEKFINLRAELWWSMREWFMAKSCSIPRDERMTQDLASVRYDFTSNGKTRIESKEQMMKRRVPSPDWGDSLMLTFAGSAGIATHGWSQRRHKRSKRILKGLV